MHRITKAFQSPLSFVFLLFFLACNTTERVVDFAPDDVRPPMFSANDVAGLQAQYGSVDGVYLTYNHTLEHNVSIAFTSTIPHWKFFEMMDRSVVVFNVNAPELNAFRLQVPASHRLEQAYISVQAPGASPAVYRKEDLVKDVDADGNTVYSISYAGIQPGTVITERYEVSRSDLERNPPLMHDIPLQFELPVQNLNFQYIYPIWWQVKVKNLSLNQPLNYERIEDAERRKIILRYRSQDVPAFVDGPGAPYFKQAAPYFQLMVTNLTMGSALRVRAPEDWTEFARDYRQYATDLRARPSRTVKRTTDQLVGHLSSDIDRVETLLNYVTDNIRIDPSSRQRSMDMVAARREGNPYMVAGLMQAMLAAANIDSEYLLVHPAYEGYFDPEFYSEVQLKDPALGVLLEGEQYYVFPGRQRSITDPIPPEYAGQPAIVITPDGFGGFTEIFGEQQPPAAPLIVDRGSTVPVERGPAQPVVQDPPPVQPVVQDPPPVQPVVQDPPPALPAGNRDPVTQPSTRTRASGGSGAPRGGSPIGTPIGTPQTGPGPEIVEAQPPPVDRPEPLALPDWLGSIKRSVGGWTWIVASRTSMEEAEAVANQYIDLYRQGLSVDVLAGESNGVVRYRIAIGQYPNRNLAQRDRERLGALLPADAWLLQIEPNM